MKKLIYLLSLSFSMGLTAQDCELPSPYTNGSTGNNLTTLLHSSFLEPLDLTSPAPYIVALTPAGQIVGSACIDSDCLSGGMQSVAIWGDDTLTPEIDGAQEGELITLKIIDGTQLNIVFSSPITYTANGTILIASGSMNYECTGLVEGCTNPIACNYNELATEDDGSCIEAEDYYDCDGNCVTDTDGDGICDELEILGCIEPMACNYNPDATEELDCIYPELYHDCDGECINDDDNDGICNEEEEPGCTNYFACNYDEEATDDDGSCIVIHAVLSFDIDNNILSVSTNATAPEIIWLFEDSVIPFEHSDSLSILGEGMYEVIIFDSTNDCGASDTLSVNLIGLEESLSNHISLYPNPAQSYLTVELKDSARITIFDTFGALMYQARIQKETIPVAQYASGIYFLKIEENGKTVVYPWIKE